MANLSGTAGKVITCKAAVVWEFNKPVSIETIQVEPPKAHEVRVKIEAVGLCHSDLSALQGHQDFQPLPFVFGHEGGGIVESIGEGVTNIKPGDKVFTLFVPHCGNCENCQEGSCNICYDTGRKEQHMFPQIRTLGLDGTPRFWCKGKPLHFYFGSSAFSEYTTIAANSCVKVNPATPLDKAVILSCGFSTGYGSSANAVNIKPGNSVAVWGMGGVGLATVLGCKHKGATKIIGIDVCGDKETIAKKIGCTDFICAKDLEKSMMEIIAEMTGGRGVHYAFVCIGNIQSMETAVLTTRPGGTTVIVGVAPDTATMKVSPAFLLSGRSILGCLIGNYNIHEDLPSLANSYLDGKLPLEDFITHRFKLEDINDALQIMKAGKSIRSVIKM